MTNDQMINVNDRMRVQRMRMIGRVGKLESLDENIKREGFPFSSQKEMHHNSSFINPIKPAMGAMR